MSVDITDDFNRPGPEMGAASGVDGNAYTWYESLADFQIVSNRVLTPNITTGGVISATCCIDPNQHGETDGADGFVEVTLVGPGSSGLNRGMSWRMSNDQQQGWLWDGDGIKYDTDFDTGMNSVEMLNVGHTMGDRLRVEMEGPEMRFFKNGVQVGTITSTLYQTNHRHGLFSYRGPDSTRGWDDFAYGPLEDLPVRIYPRDDGRGLSSAPRLYPRPSSEERIYGAIP